jgi:ABC-type lipoprotein export system ATPase subunit
VGIKLSEVSVILPNQRKLFAIPSLSIASGDKCLIEGPSGVGKTTLIHLLAGLFDPSEGYVFVDEQNLKFLSDASRCALRRKRFGIIFQKLNLLDHLTALENVLIGVSHPNKKELARGALREVGMESFCDIVVANLSQGEQQRVATARILAGAPDFILADEPTSSLDDKNSTAVLDALFRLSKSTLVLVSHDHRVRDRFSTIYDFKRWVSP